MKKIRLISVCIAAVLCAACAFSVFASAAQTTLPAIETSKDTTPETTDGGVIVQTVNLINANKNQRGTGMFWDNPNDTLTITNMTIDTPENYGLRLPSGATLMLEGNNTIKASYCALSTEGSLTVKGNGTLTLISDNYGIIVSTLDTNKKITFLDGKVTIKSQGDGIYTEYSIVTQNNKAKLEINTPDSAYAINARQVKLLGGEFKSNSSVFAEDIKVMEQSIDISSSRPAFIIDGASAEAPYERLSIKNISFKTGTDSASLAKAEVYNGETCFVGKTHRVNDKTSAFLELFGVKAAGTYWLDFVLIALVVVIVAVFIATPYIKNHRDKPKIAQKIAAAREEEKQNMHK